MVVYNNKGCTRKNEFNKGIFGFQPTLIKNNHNITNTLNVKKFQYLPTHINTNKMHKYKSTFK
jgi:hypothetical protein